MQRRSLHSIDLRRGLRSSSNDNGNDVLPTRHEIWKLIRETFQILEILVFESRNHQDYQRLHFGSVGLRRFQKSLGLLAKLSAGLRRRNILRASCAVSCIASKSPPYAFRPLFGPIYFVHLIHNAQPAFRTPKSFRHRPIIITQPSLGSSSPSSTLYPKSSGTSLFSSSRRT